MCEFFHWGRSLNTLLNNQIIKGCCPIGQLFLQEVKLIQYRPVACYCFIFYPFSNKCVINSGLCTEEAEYGSICFVPKRLNMDHFVLYHICDWTVLFNISSPFCVHEAASCFLVLQKQTFEVNGPSIRAMQPAAVTMGGVVTLVPEL